jgi:hypothetical protein
VNWTTTPPTEPGWYWLRVGPRPDEVVQVLAGGGALWVHYRGDGIPIAEVGDGIHPRPAPLWAGPIQRPEAG